MDLSTLTRDQLWQVEELASAAVELLRPSRDPKIETIRAQICRCRHRHPIASTLGDVERLRDQCYQRNRDLDRQEREQDERERKEKHDQAIARRTSSGGWTLRQETVKCGKPDCDKLHGPYWYGYKTIGGRVRKRYFGKDKPTPQKLAEAEAALLGKRSPAPSTASPKKARR